MKSDWHTKQHYKDSSTSYPTYGRGLTPNIDMNTFMVQEQLGGAKKEEA